MNSFFLGLGSDTMMQMVERCEFCVEGGFMIEL